MNENFPMQICQDPELIKKFADLHHKLVNEVITFCKENNLNDISEFFLNADGLNESIKYGYWTPVTDSFFTLENEHGERYLMSA